MKSNVMKKININKLMKELIEDIGVGFLMFMAAVLLGYFLKIFLY